MEWFLSLIQDPKTGAAVVLAVWLFFERQGRLDERNQRIKMQEERNQLLERVLTGLNNSTAAHKATNDTLTNVHGVLSSTKDMLPALLIGRITAALPPSIGGDK